MHRRIPAVLIVLLLALGLVMAVPAGVLARPAPVTKQPTAVGTGGAVATVDLDASKVGLDVLRKGGNAVDAAVATAAALGVTEPYSAGIGGGGFMVVYLARQHRIVTIDGRETAPAAMREDSFIDPATGAPTPLAERITSGLGVGVPGTPKLWRDALRRWGTIDLDEALAPAARLADRGFVVDATFRQQTLDNLARFRAFPATAELYLPGGDAPAVGTTLRNPDLADTYRLLARTNTAALYEGRLAREIVDAVRRPPVAADATLNVRPGLMRAGDLEDYETVRRAPTKVSYRGLDVWAMGPPSSGGTTVGEALNILEGFDLGDEPRAEALHHYLEASRLAYADRNRWVGDPGYVDVPVSGLLSQRFADERRCQIGDTAATSPVAPGDPFPPFERECEPAAAAAGATAEGPNTTHLTTADKHGNVVAYTLTIEQTGGSGITVPGRGFLLNNELTDFNPEPLFAGVPDPNLPAPGKRPRSSIAPTIVTRHGRPVLALGSPGGATIITTVLQTLVNHLDFGLGLPEAIAAPRASQRNGAATEAEPAFIASPEAAALRARGHTFTELAEIGAATGIRFRRDGTMQAAAEPVRRGGGSALVVHPE